jgi:hypothetical protein
MCSVIRLVHVFFLHARFVMFLRLRWLMVLRTFWFVALPRSADGWFPGERSGRYGLAGICSTWLFELVWFAWLWFVPRWFPGMVGGSAPCPRTLFR